MTALKKNKSTQHEKLIKTIENQQLEIKRLTEEYEKQTHTLNFILQQLPVNVFWKNREGVYLGNNNYAKVHMYYFGFTSDVIGKTDDDIFSHEIADKFKKSDQIVLTGESLQNEENIILPDGKELFYLSSKIPLLDQFKNIIGVLGISIDITERKKLEQNLLVAKENAEIANQAKNEFLENMRHDIRTPLTGIVGCAQLIQMHPNLPEKINEFANDLVLSSDALLDFLNKILESITVASGQIPLLKKRFSLEEVLQQIINLNKPQAVVKKLDLSFDYDEALPVYLIGDSVRIHRILLELLTNALKYTDAGSIKVSASLAKTEEREIVVELRVSDTGMGIPHDKHDEVYARFKRLTPAYEGIYPGTGLGLSLVKQFIDDLDGEIRIESELKQGTSFICLIPFQKALLMDASYSKDLKVGSLVKKRIINEPLAPKLVTSNGSRILVIEDNLIAVNVARNILSELGCQVDVALDGKTALKKIEENHYDLILTDMGLPDANGNEITQCIRTNSQRNPLTPIVGLTAHIEKGQKKRCLSDGMNAVLNKPLTRKKAIKILSTFSSSQNQFQTPGISCNESTDSILSIPILDMPRAIKRLGKKKFVEECLQLSTLREDLIIIKQGYLDKNWSIISGMAHKWAGGSNYCSASRLERISRQLRTALLNKQPLEQADILYQQFTEVSEATIEAIEKLFP